MSTLTEFLLARIAEDEVIAQTVTVPLGVSKTALHTISIGEDPAKVGAWVHPARVLAECEAKRAIVAQWQTAVLTEAHEDEAPNDYPESYVRAVAQTEAMETVLRVLAVPYADHPDYLPEW